MPKLRVFYRWWPMNVEIGGRRCVRRPENYYLNHVGGRIVSHEFPMIFSHVTLKKNVEGVIFRGPQYGHLG